ncbi:MAG: hypothetical protein JSV36_06435, partial [Anaerolineae bacterium]
MLESEAPPVEMSDAETVEPAGEGWSRKQVGQAIELVVLLLGLLLTALAGGALTRRDKSLPPDLALLAAYVAVVGALLVLSAGGAGLAWLGIVRPATEAIPGDVQPWLAAVLQVFGLGLGAAGGGVAWWRLYGHARARGWLPDGFRPRVLYVILALSV